MQDESMQTYSGAKLAGPGQIDNSIYSRLLMQKKQLEDNLEKVNKAIELLDKAPETKEIIEAISKVTHF